MLIKVFRWFSDFYISILSLVNKFRIIIRGGSVGSNFRCAGWIRIYGRGRIKIGDNVTINSSLRSNPVTGDRATIFILRSGATLEIENDVGISNSVFACRSHIRLGEGSLIGSGCKIYDNDFHSLFLDERLVNLEQGVKVRAVDVGKGCFVGALVILLKGSKIGDRSVIGAGSVIAASVPEGEIWVGNPAKFVKALNH